MGAGRIHAVGAHTARVPAGDRVPFKRRNFHNQSFPLRGLQRTDICVQPGAPLRKSCVGCAGKPAIQQPCQLADLRNTMLRSCSSSVELKPRNRRHRATAPQRSLWCASTTRTRRLTRVYWIRSLRLKKSMDLSARRTFSRKRTRSASGTVMRKAITRSTRKSRYAHSAAFH